MFCKNCGEKLVEKDEFCENCGSKAKETGSENKKIIIPIKTNIEETMNKKQRVILWILATWWTILSGFTIFGAIINKGPGLMTAVSTIFIIFGLIPTIPALIIFYIFKDKPAKTKEITDANEKDKITKENGEKSKWIIWTAIAIAIVGIYGFGQWKAIENTKLQQAKNQQGQTCYRSCPTCSRYSWQDQWNCRTN